MPALFVFSFLFPFSFIFHGFSSDMASPCHALHVAEAAGKGCVASPRLIPLKTMVQKTNASFQHSASGLMLAEMVLNFT
jgi:hypothetical protein